MSQTKNTSQALITHIGQRLHQRRKKVGLSLAALAEKLGISHQQLYKYEKGLNSIPSDRLYYLSAALDVPLTYFFEGFTEHQDGRVFSTKRGESLSILVIEDDPADAILLRRALENCEKENTVDLVNDGREALDMLNNRSKSDNGTLPDLIFLDLNIPTIEGFSLLKEIKKNSNLSNIPIIIITNSMNDADVIKSYKGHASGVIRKTGNIEEFNKHIASTVDCWSSAMTLPVI